MKLKDLLLEGRVTKTLGKNKKVMEMLENLRKNPGSAVLEKIQTTLNEAGSQDDMTSLFEKIKSKYKKLDNEVAEMIEKAIYEIDSASVQEKNQKLETIKQHASTIQGKLQKEVKKSKKKK